MANILVVDDELGIRDLLSEILNDEGHTVELAENAAQARTLRESVRPDLVLLDEATATLDQQTEARVLAASRITTTRRTSVIVAHRLATAAQADSISVIESGRVIQQGSHAELIAVGGRYRELWESSADTAGADSHSRA